VVDASGGVDAAATVALRDQMTASRPALTLFNRGGTIEELKARSLEETHLPPPRSPEFAFRKAAAAR
jgi:N-methylhydantoinase B